MYLYFDKNGNLKEIINDLPARVGNSNWNRIYVYWEGQSDEVNNVWIKYYLPDLTFYTYHGTAELPWNIGTDVESGIYTGAHFIPPSDNCYIPYDKNRELKFFEYFKQYEFYMFVVPDGVMAQVGSVGITINYVTDESVIAMGQYGYNAFYVASAGKGFAPDENINVAQWNELKKIISQLVVGNADIRRNTTEQWNAQTYLISELNAIYVYTDTGRIKIGDGSTYLIDMPYSDTYALEQHINNTNIHVSLEEKQKWDDKLNYVDPGNTELLEFTRE